MAHCLEELLNISFSIWVLSGYADQNNFSYLCAMNIKERWNAEESKFGKYLKFIIGYLFTLSGVIADLTSQYIPLVSSYVPDKLVHTLVFIGVVGYTLGKLTTNKDGDDHRNGNPPPGHFSFI